MVPSRLAVAAFLTFASLAAPAAAATLAQGLSSYRTNHVADAERIFAEVAADPAATPRDRAQALRELGRIDGLIRGETDAIATAIAQAPQDETRCEIGATALIVYRNAGQPATPLAFAEGASATCTPGALESLRIELARTHLALAASSPSDRALHLAAAAAQLDAIEAAARGAPTVASTRLSLAIARRDSAAALTAWRDYFWLTDADSPQAMQQYAGRTAAVLDAGLNANADDDSLLALIEMLIRAGFVADARQFAAETNIGARANGNAQWRRASAYLAFDQNVRAITLGANRTMATGGRATTYEADIQAAMAQLMTDAGLSGDPKAALMETYGVYGTLGETSGYPSLHGGHLVQDEHLAVAQYGRSGELRFIVIDNMTANGFESWLWDGWAEAGGWANDDGIIQVRSAYTDGPLNALRLARPGPIRERYLADLERAVAQERESLGRDGVAALPATSDRLDLQAIDQIAARVGADDQAFIAAHWRETINYSITLHEGRHALDNASGAFSSENLEFRAKLSQIALSDFPRLGLANIAGNTIGDTPHGNANRRILQGYRTWMRRHRGDIAGFDRTRPTLSQLDKLTDAQIVDGARSMDAWARD